MKKGLSPIIASVLMIVLVLVVAGIVFGVVSNLIRKEVEKTESCFGIFDKVEFNNEFTCGFTGELEDFGLASVNVGDIELNKIIFVITDSTGQSRTMEIERGGIYTDVAVFEGIGIKTKFEIPLLFPEANQGYTYAIKKENLEDWHKIKLSVEVGGENCGVLDTLTFENCPASYSLE